MDSQLYYMLQDLKNLANVKRCRDSMPNVCKQGRDYSEGKSSLHHFHASLQLDVKRCRARALLIYLFNVFFLVLFLSFFDVNLSYAVRPKPKKNISSVTTTPELEMALTV